GTNFDWVLKKKIEPGRLSVGSAHPHGSIQASSDAKTGAINPDFELYGHKNIFVMDACWIPTGLSVNPQITTMSSNLRAARKLAGQKADRI
ncbi:MAG: GMC family oxidoreductase, partial [Spirochaetia bacterium]|nr:GMC family oxidoreductase [Spirochaetia bacterium]